MFERRKIEKRFKSDMDKVRIPYVALNAQNEHEERNKCMHIMRTAACTTLAAALIVGGTIGFNTVMNGSASGPAKNHSFGLVACAAEVNKQATVSNYNNNLFDGPYSCYTFNTDGTGRFVNSYGFKVTGDNIIAVNIKTNKGQFYKPLDKGNDAVIQKKMRASTQKRRNFTTVYGETCDDPMWDIVIPNGTDLTVDYTKNAQELICWRDIENTAQIAPVIEKDWDERADGDSIVRLEENGIRYKGVDWNRAKEFYPVLAAKRDAAMAETQLVVTVTFNDGKQLTKVATFEKTGSNAWNVVVK